MVPEVNGNAIIQSYIEDFKSSRMSVYTNNLNWYTGKHPILNRVAETMVDSEGNTVKKPNNKLVFQFPKLIIDTSHSYLAGKPLSYTNNKSLNKPEYDDTDEFISILKDIFIDNDEPYKTAELLKNCSIEGDGYEYVYVSKIDGQIKFVEFPAYECIPVYDPSTKELEMVIRFYEMELLNANGKKETFYKVETYDKDYVTYYNMKNGKVTLDLEKPAVAHLMQEVPIIHYRNTTISNSDYGISDLEDVKTLIDEYEQKCSDLSNTLEYNTNPLLKLTNCIVDEGQFAEMVASRIIQLPEGATAEYLVWDQNIPALKNHLEKIEDAIYTFSFTPKLYRDNDDGNPMSGVSIKMKFSGADLKANTKERNYRLGLRKRIRLISKLLKLINNKNYNWRDVDVTFNRSIPQNLLELAQIAAQLHGLISDETLMENIPFVADIKTEMERVAKQKATTTQTENTDTTGGGVVK